ncbi:hypothetical protein [Saccharothrix sp.]|uniref:hypothetical protein n=1 Tax=Saccharothrix sp. TaxID=1873460 RepID=UPI002810A7CB|nr:hypothetical protein [Saccharothrix sp.]
MNDYAATFEQTWADPANTRYELPPVDVNRTLAERYELSEPLVFTQDMLWDMEVRKARRPDLFIPTVVAAGSADSWGEGDTFVRRSMQRSWTAPEEYTLVLERTHVDHATRMVTFLGTPEHPGPDGELLRAGDLQPIFHVQHGAGGTQDQPLNLWRIVHLTDAVDTGLLRVFDRMAENPWLPEFVEIYVRDVLGVGLTRR